MSLENLSTNMRNSQQDETKPEINLISNATIIDIPEKDSLRSEHVPNVHINNPNNIPTIVPSVPNSTTPGAIPIGYRYPEERIYPLNPPNNPMSQNNFNFNENTYSATHYVEAPPEDINLQKTWQYGKTIKCLSIIDLFFIVMNSLIVWPIIISIIFPICGYYGSKRYEVNRVFIYLFYCFIRAVSIVIQLTYSFKNKNYYDDGDSANINNRLHSDASQCFLIFSLMVQLWITWIVYRFTSSLRSLSHDKLNILKIGTFIPIESRVLFY